MKKSLISLSAIAVAVFTAQVAVAQDAAPKTRAEVKAEAAAANKAGTIEKGAAVPKAAKPTSDKARAEVKAEAAAANKAGTIEKGASVQKATKPTSDHSRAETKAEAAAANKSGEAKTMNQPTAVVAPKK
jgi:stress response protein YsnF